MKGEDKGNVGYSVESSAKQLAVKKARREKRA